LIAGIAVTAGAAGFFIGRVSSPTHAGNAGDSKGASASAWKDDGNGEGNASRNGGRASQSATMVSDQRVPWTRDRLVNAARQTLSAGSVFAGIPRAIRICETLEKEDFPMALQVAGSMSADYDDHEVFQVFVMNRWAQLDPRGFADYLQKTPSSDPLHFMDETADIIMPVWLEQNQLEAVQWVKGVADPGKRKELMEKVVGVMAKLDPDGVVAFTRVHAPELLGDKGLPEAIVEAWKNGIPEDAARRLAEAGDTTELRDVAVRWAKKDQGAAMKWAQGLAEPEQRKQALIGVFSLWATKDFDKALVAAIENDDGQTSGHVLDAVLDSWPAKDVASFQGRAASLPNGPVRVKGYGVIANKLAQQNATTAAEWLLSLPISAEKDEAMSKFAVAAVGKHGAAAMEWAGAIGEPAKRESALRAALGEWFRNDPAAAYRWTFTSDIMLADEKQALLRP
jgi:hypothetical protein